MNVLQVRMLLCAGVSVFVGGSLGLSAKAQSSPQMSISGPIHVHHRRHHSTTLTSDTFTSVDNDGRDPLKEKACILETKIMKLDRDITASLEKITQLEIFQSQDKANPLKNAEAIEIERESLDQKEDELSEVLKEQEVIHTQIAARTNENSQNM
jgi:hypothetical protein